MRTTDQIRERARSLAQPLGWAAIALVVGWVIWTRNVAGGTDVPGPVELMAVIAVIFAARLARTDEDGSAFAASGIAIAATVGSIFIDLYPRVIVSSTSSAYDLTVNNSASGHYALTVMTIVAAIFARSCSSTRAGPSTSFEHASRPLREDQADARAGATPVGPSATRPLRQSATTTALTRSLLRARPAGDTRAAPGAPRVAPSRRSRRHISA